MRDPSTMSCLVTAYGNPHRTVCVRCATLFACLAFLFFNPASIAHGEDNSKLPARKPDGSDYSGNHFHLTPLTISGTARNDQDEPVANADVIIGHPSGFSMGFNRPDGSRASVDPIYGRGKTSDAGEYSIEIRLPVIHYKAAPVPKPAQGSFRVVSMAAGYGFTWTGARHFRSGSRPQNLPKDEAASALYEDEPLRFDLQFKPEVRLHGVMEDDAGTALAGARLQLGLVNTSRDTVGHAPKMANVGLLGGKGPDRLLSMGVQLIPEQFRTTRTNEKGEFELRGIPRDASMLAFADYRFEFPPQEFSLITAKGENARNRFHVGHEGELNLRFERPQSVRVQIVGADTRKPVAGATVRVQTPPQVRQSFQRAGSLDHTGEFGIATLKLPPNDYVLVVEPPTASDYAAFRRRITVRRSPEPIEIGYRLGLATTVRFKAIDADTGKPLSGIDFTYETDTSIVARPVHSQTVIVDHPRTGSDGTFTARMQPGRCRFIPGPGAARYELVDATDELIDLIPGESTTLEFRFRRKAGANLTKNGLPAPTYTRKELQQLSDDLLAKWNRQRELTSHGRYRVVRNNFLRTELPFEDVRKVVDGLEGKSRSDIVASLKGLFPNFGSNEMLYVTDGTRVAYASINRRDQLAWRWQGEPVRDVYAFNGREQLSYSWVNRQLDIHERSTSRLYLTQLSDLLVWPGMIFIRGPQDEITIERNNDRIQIANAEGQDQMIVDRETGFLHRQRSTFRNRGRTVWQFLPRELPGGAIVPGVFLSIQHSGGKITRAEVSMIRQAQLVDSLPPETFAIPAPAGTMILDYRGIDPRAARRRPSFLTVSHAVSDAVTLANEALQRNAAVGLQQGQNIPGISAAEWLDDGGETEAPIWQGRLTLLLFLKSDSRSGMRRLPEVRRAVKHFADRDDLLIVGVHTAGAGPEFVSAWLDSNDLPLKVGIDKPSRQNRLGQTAHDWKVRSVPESFLFDEQGKLLQQGQFDWCLSTVGRILEQRKKKGGGRKEGSVHGKVT